MCFPFALCVMCLLLCVCYLPSLFNFTQSVLECVLFNIPVKYYRQHCVVVWSPVCLQVLASPFTGWGIVVKLLNLLVFISFSENGDNNSF